MRSSNYGYFSSWAGTAAAAVSDQRSRHCLYLLTKCSVNEDRDVSLMWSRAEYQILAGWTASAESEVCTVWARMFFLQRHSLVFFCGVEEYKNKHKTVRWLKEKCGIREIKNLYAVEISLFIFKMYAASITLSNIQQGGSR